MMRCFDYGKLFSGQLIGVALKAGRGDYPPPISGLSSIVRQELSGSPPVNGPDASLARSPAGEREATPMEAVRGMMAVLLASGNFQALPPARLFLR